jgi:hypothetical protein
MCSDKEKMLKVILKDGMIGRVECQAFKLRLTKDFNETQWQFENNSKMMLENECSCTFSKMLS